MLIQPQWGSMSVQQMIEHLSDAVRMASGKFQPRMMVTPEENLPAMQQFLMSDQALPKGVQNPLLPKDPPPVKKTSKEEAIAELQSEISHFFSVFEENNQHQTLHLYFGQLDFTMNVQALYKHCIHHLSQFGVTI